MSIFEAAVRRYARLLDVIEKEKECNNIWLLHFSDDEKSEEERDLCWRLLSHPYSKVTEVRLHGTYCQLERQGLFRLVRRWCEELPLKAPRTVSLSFLCEEVDDCDVFEDLREALTRPNNGVTALVIRTWLGSERFVLGDILLRPVLESPNNVLEVLILDDLKFADSADMKALLVGFRSPNCKLKHLRITQGLKSLEFEDRRLFIRCLAALSELEILEAAEALMLNRNAEEGTALMHCLANVLIRPGNIIRDLYIPENSFSADQVHILSQAMTNEYCRLEQLDISNACKRREGPGAVRALAAAIRHPNNRLKKLVAEEIQCDEAAFTAIGACLTDRNCKLESLRIGKCARDSSSADPIAKALEPSTCSCLKILTLHNGQPPTFFRAMAQSLLSQNNKLTVLAAQGIRDTDAATRDEFYRAVRVSGVAFHDSSTTTDTTEFDEPFRKVLYALLSIKYVSRLGTLAVMRILPVQDLILRIADTLGWSL